MVDLRVIEVNPATNQAWTMSCPLRSSHSILVFWAWGNIFQDLSL